LDNAKARVNPPIPPPLRSSRINIKHPEVKEISREKTNQMATWNLTGGSNMASRGGGKRGKLVPK
jgi:hypothetical protein